MLAVSGDFFYKVPRVMIGARATGRDKNVMPEITFSARYIDIIRRNLRRLRGAMTQEKFAEKIGVSLTTIQRIESGENFYIESLLKIAEALNIKPFEFFLDDTEKGEIRAELAELRALLKDTERTKKEIVAELAKEYGLKKPGVDDGAGGKGRASGG